MASEFHKKNLSNITNNEREKMIEKLKNGKFFDLENYNCNHPNHLPPNFIYIPFGKGYRHICPLCNKITEIIPPQISC